MCGIAGIVSLRADRPCDAALTEMVRVQAHRGPDGQGTWCGQVGRAHIALGSVRLAILDLSDAGLQPMRSGSGRQVLVYNGEIYNYRELRTELQGLGVQFQTHGDTEVVLHALTVWGESAFARFNGMWALAWLDQDAGTLLLSRDRFGIKPLYWHLVDDHCLFASEIKGILVGSGRRFEINPVAVGRYLLQSQLDAQEQTFFTGIEALPPGHVVRLDLRHPDGLRPVRHRYWAAPHEEILRDGTPPDFAAVRETFIDSVRLRLRSDVAVGVLLSGGVDSSSIAVAMQHVLGRDAQLQVLSSVSDDPRFSEAPFIDRMATFLGGGTSVSRVQFTPDDAFRLLDRVIWFNDEPVGTLSPVAHYLLMQRAQELGVTVILCGQGGDELLCGYLKYWGFYLQSLFRSGQFATGLRVFSELATRGTVLPHLRLSEAKRYLPKQLMPKEIDIRGPALHTDDVVLDIGLRGEGVVDRQLADLSRFSLPALLHYEDRMSMAFGREIRLPYLDYRLVTMLLPLAPSWKMRHGWSKWAFRKAMELDLPADIVWRRDKQGFSNPVSEWLKIQLRPHVERMLRDDMLIAAHGFVDQRALRRRFEAYCRYPADRGPLSFKDIFNSVVLEIWARRFEGFLATPATA
ncbi:MAG: asparagine synthase (glutamine-hydrolyzing) [Gemmatimonadales bacterium]